jgi:ribonuclease HI
MATRWYVVYIGHVPGVYEHWEDVQAQVNGFPGNCYKGYKTRMEAEAH